MKPMTHNLHTLRIESPRLGSPSDEEWPKGRLFQQRSDRAKKQKTEAREAKKTWQAPFGVFSSG